MSDSTRPNDEALVTSRVTPLVVMVHRYSACVCAETMTLIDGSSRCAMSAIGLPVEVAGAAVERGRGLEAALVDDEHRLLTPVAQLARGAVRGVRLVLEGEPGDPVGVTIVGVSLRTSPMKPTPTCGCRGWSGTA